MLWRASVKSYISSLSLLMIESKSRWQTDSQTDQRILLSSLFELISLLFEVMVLSRPWSYHLPSSSKHPCEAVGKRGTDTEESTTLGAGAAAAAWSCDGVMEEAGANGQTSWFCFWPCHCFTAKALELWVPLPPSCKTGFNRTRSTMRWAEKCRILLVPLEGITWAC